MVGGIRIVLVLERGDKNRCINYIPLKDILKIVPVPEEKLWVGTISRSVKRILKK